MYAVCVLPAHLLKNQQAPAHVCCVCVTCSPAQKKNLLTCSKTSKRQHMYAVCVLPAHLLKTKTCSPAQKPASASTCMLCVLMLYGLNENDIYNQLGILNQLGRRESLSGAVENAKPVSPPRT